MTEWWEWVLGACVGVIILLTIILIPVMIIHQYKTDVYCGQNPDYCVRDVCVRTEEQTVPIVTYINNVPVTTYMTSDVCVEYIQRSWTKDGAGMSRIKRKKLLK